MTNARDPEEFRAEAPALLEAPSLERLRSLALEGGKALACEGATRIVPGEGNPHAALVLVGEAPGEQEDREGRPFVGRSGKLLDQILATAGLDRSDVWITNAVKCRPTTEAAGRVRNRAPRAGELSAWRSVLHDELGLIRPRLLVGLGAVAGRALVGPEFRITQGRGRVIHDTVVGLPLIVTWHPAYLLRQTGDAYQDRLKEAIADFKLAKERLEALKGQS